MAIQANGGIQTSGKEGRFNGQQQGEHFKVHNGDKSGKTGGRSKQNDKDGEKILRDFVWAYRDLVDRNSGDRFFKGDPKVINAVLNQIHWRSLDAISISMRGLAEEREINSYKQTLVGNKDDNTSKNSNLDGKRSSINEEGWTLVQRRKRGIKSSDKSLFTIFMYNVPFDVPAKSMWSELKGCGKIIDIILPRKRDKRNRRIGFQDSFGRGSRLDNFEC